jgi:hypothetical protein
MRHFCMAMYSNGNESRETGVSTEYQHETYGADAVERWNAAHRCWRCGLWR